MENVSDVSKLKMEPKTTLKASDIHIHDFSLDGRTAGPSGGDILEMVARAAKQATQTSPRTSIKMDAFDVDFEGLRADLGDDSPEDVLLREARRLTKDAQYQTALAKLEEVLAIAPNQPEAIYLKAFCKYSLGTLKPALKVLLELKGVVLKNRLRTRVQTLKEDIRQKTLPMAARIYSTAMQTRQASKAISPLLEFAQTDPEVGKFHYFLAGAYLINKQFKEAREAAREGVAVCETDRKELQQLHLQIEEHFLPQMLGPARKLFRARKYAEAAVALAEVPEDAHDTAMWIAFEGFLRQFGTSSSTSLLSRVAPGRMKAGTDPPGTPAEVKALYEFLVEPEMKVARASVKSGQAGTAEPALKAALAHTPNFSVANHMLATCVYQRVGARVKNKIGKDIDDNGARELRACSKELDAVRDMAIIASRDPEIPDAKRLLNSIDQMRKDIQGVLDTHETQVHDAKLVNKAIDDFIQVLMQMFALRGASGRYEVIAAATSLYSKLGAMRNELPALRRQCKGQQARQIMELLRDKFVEPNYQVLRQAMGR